jgi:hypothetical protein
LGFGVAGNTRVIASFVVEAAPPLIFSGTTSLARLPPAVVKNSMVPSFIGSHSVLPSARFTWS